MARASEDSPWRYRKVSLAARPRGLPAARCGGRSEQGIGASDAPRRATDSTRSTAARSRPSGRRSRSADLRAVWARPQPAGCRCGTAAPSGFTRPAQFTRSCNTDHEIARQNHDMTCSRAWSRPPYDSGSDRRSRPANDGASDRTCRRSEGPQPAPRRPQDPVAGEGRGRSEAAIGRRRGDRPSVGLGK